jgi:hypothetical protein
MDRYGELKAEAQARLAAQVAAQTTPAKPKRHYKLITLLTVVITLVVAGVIGITVIHHGSSSWYANGKTFAYQENSDGASLIGMTNEEYCQEVSAKAGAAGADWFGSPPPPASAGSAARWQWVGGCTDMLNQLQPGSAG